MQWNKEQRLIRMKNEKWGAEMQTARLTGRAVALPFSVSEVSLNIPLKFAENGFIWYNRLVIHQEQENLHAASL